METETIITIKWDSGYMSFIAEKFFPITAEKMTKLYKSCVKRDWEHREEIVQQMLESLNRLQGHYKAVLEQHIARKNQAAENLACASTKENKEKWKAYVAAAKEDVRNTNQTLKQVQKNIEQLKLLSAAKK